METNGIHDEYTGLIPTHSIESSFKLYKTVFTKGRPPLEQYADNADET